MAMSKGKTPKKGEGAHMHKKTTKKGGIKKKAADMKMKGKKGE